MEKLTEDQLIELNTKIEEAHKKHKDWRMGQTCFNVLYELYPNIANKLRGSSANPFYNNHKIGAFWQYLMQHLYLL